MSELDAFLPPHNPPAQADAFAALAPADAVGQGQYRPAPEDVLLVAMRLAELWTGGNIADFGGKVRFDLKKAAAIVLADSGGDIADIQRAANEIRADKFQREACRMCHTAYGVARHLYSKVALMKARLKEKPVDYSDYIREESLLRDDQIQDDGVLERAALEPASIDPTWSYIVADLGVGGGRRDILLDADVTHRDGVLWVGLLPEAEWQKPAIARVAAKYEIKLEWMK